MADPEDDDFLSRWSRRKRGEHPEQTPAEPIDQVVEVAAPESSGEEAQGDPEVIARLPEIDGMDDSSDFTVFLKAGVPEVLRRRALRKLWRVNPLLANLDGLNDYDEDYTQLSALGRGMKTLYRVGKGFATDESDEVAEGDPSSDVTDDPETRPPELPSSDESEPQADPVETVLNRADVDVRESAEPASKSKGAAHSRRWGAPEKPS